MNKQIILLNGPSSSGKSSLSKALQAVIWERLAIRYEIVSIDDFMKTNPMETIYEDDVFEISGDLCERVLDEMKAGAGVIIDHVITSERIFEQLKSAVQDYPLRSVQVRCPLQILKQRELERGDRCPGSAESSYQYLYPKAGYDQVVDTGSHSQAENASIIFERFFCDARCE